MISFKDFFKGFSLKEFANAYREAKAMEVETITMDELTVLERRLMEHLKRVVEYYGDQEGDYTIGTDFTALYHRCGLTRPEIEEAVKRLTRKQLIKTFNDCTREFVPLVSKCHLGHESILLEFRYENYQYVISIL